MTTEFAPTTLDAVERSTWKTWRAHEDDCRQCIATKHTFCETGHDLLMTWRASIHLAEYGEPMTSDGAAAIERARALCEELERTNARNLHSVADMPGEDTYGVTS